MKSLLRLNRFIAVVLAAVIIQSSAPAQSGRGRPKVPTADQPSTPAPPAKVPASTEVVATSKIGDTSNYSLRNGMSVMISEQHRSPSAAVAACLKFDVLKDVDTTAAALLMERLAKAQALRSAKTASAAAAWPTVSSTFDGGIAFTTIAQSERLDDVLAYHAGLLKQTAFSDDLLQKVRAELADELKWDTELIDAESVTQGEQEEAFGFSSDKEGLGFAPEKIGIREAAAMSLAQTWSKDDKSLLARAIDLPLSGLREKLDRFRAAFWRPENLCLSVVGDALLFKTLVSIEGLYGDFGLKLSVEPAEASSSTSKTGKSEPRGAERQSGSIPARVKQAPVKQEQVKQEQVKNSVDDIKPAAAAPTPWPRYVERRSDSAYSVVTVGFAARDAGERDIAALEVLAALAGKGRASRLKQTLLYNQRVAQRASADFYKSGRNGVISFQATAEPSSIDKAESSLFKEIDALRRAAPLPEDLTRAKTILERGFLESTGTYSGEARALALCGFAETAGFIKAIEQVTAEDVQAVAAKYLHVSGLSVCEIEPVSAPARTFNSESYARTVTAWAPGLAEELNLKREKPPIAKGKPEGSQSRIEASESMAPLPIRDFSTYNGPRAFVREDHSLRLVTLAILFQGGRILEDAASSGAAETMLRAMLTGTSRRTRGQIAADLDQLGAAVRIVAEPDYCGYLVSVVSRNAEPALRIMHDVIEDPAFKAEDLELARAEQLVEIRSANGQPEQRASTLLREAFFGGHSYALPIHGREDVVAKISADQLRALHEQSVKRQYPIFVIVGDTEGSALVSGEVAEGFKRRDLEKTITVKVPQAQKPNEKAAASRFPFTIAATGFEGPKGDNPDIAFFNFIAFALTDDAGLVPLQFRAKADGALRIGFQLTAGATGGLLEFDLATSSENERIARESLTASIDRLSKGSLGADEFAAIKAGAIARTLLGQQSQRSIALEYALAIFNRRAPAEVEAEVDRLMSLKIDDVKRLIASTKPGSPFVGALRGTSTR